MKTCRICKGKNLTGFLSLGKQPHCNSFLHADQLGETEPKWDLSLLYCADCHLVQLTEAVDPDLMFRDYLYVSGTTRTLTEHFRQSAEHAVRKFALPKDSLVADIGSNDGTWLQCFRDLQMRTIGIDPARNIAEIATRRGIETIPDYFTEDTARKIRRDSGPASLITAAGVFFHIDDMDDVCRGICELLDDRGVLHVQAIYLGRMLEQTSFDNIYHEHVSYYTLHPLIHLFGRFGLTVFDVGISEIHGGSLMLYVCKNGAFEVHESVTGMLEQEKSRGWNTIMPYRDFAVRVEAIRSRLRDMILNLKNDGKRIGAYTAPAKGNTLLNYCRFTADEIESAIEKAPLKIGLFTPGSHIPVVDEAEAMQNPADYLLMLAWNFKDELLQKNSEFRSKGGKFIIPIPEPVIV